MGKGVHDQHRRVEEQNTYDKEIPCISMDYTCMGDDDTRASANPVLVSFDNGTGTLQAYVVRRKGAVMWLPEAITKDLDTLGYGKCRVKPKSDQENAIIAVKQAVAEMRRGQTSLIESPSQESKSNGRMEKAIQMYQGQLRTLKLSLEADMGVEIDVNMKTFAWLSLWAATTINRYHIGVDGQTAFQRVTGVQCNRPVAEFGEHILWKIPSTNHSQKAKTSWREGTFLGVRDRTGEIFVADHDGSVHRCRTIRACTPDEGWNAEMVLGVENSLAKAVYEFGKNNDDQSDQDGGEAIHEPNQEEPEAHMDEDEVAAMFKDSDDEDVEEDDDAMTKSETDSNPDPDAMNLLEDIRLLESTLWKDRIEENKKILMMLATGADLTEVFSPPRVATAAQELGLVPGSSLDLKTGWDFSRSQDRRKAIELIKTQRPYMIIGSPPCTLFSVLQGLNKYKNGTEWNEKFEIRKKEAVRHVEFCAALYRLQSAPGRYRLHEHPHGVRSWNLQVIAQLMRLPGVTRVRADQCAYGLTTTVHNETRPAMKPTGFLTKSWCVARELSKRCPGDHLHFSLVEGRAKAAEQYPKGLCQAICRGVSHQK